MRLPYQENPPSFTDEEDKAILERVKARRGERGLIPLDLTLLHAPNIADGWNSFLKAVRTQNSLSVSLRETAICRVAVLNKAWFEWTHHVPILEESGFSKEGIEFILKSPPTHKEHSLNSPLDEKHTLVLQYADASTKDVEVPDALFARVKEAFSNKEVVELTATIGAYNCVSRFLVALDVGEMNGKPPQ